MEDVKEIKNKDSGKGSFFQSAAGSWQALFVTRSSTSKSVIPQGTASCKHYSSSTRMDTDAGSHQYVPVVTIYIFCVDGE